MRDCTSRVSQSNLSHSSHATFSPAPETADRSTSDPHPYFRWRTKKQEDPVMSASEEPEVTPWSPHNTQSQLEEKKGGKKARSCSESFVQMPSSFFFQDRKIKNQNIVFHTANLCLSVAFRVLVVYLFISESPDTPVTFQHFHGSCHFLVSLDVVLASVLGFVMAVMFKCVYALWQWRGWRWW